MRSGWVAGLVLLAIPALAASALNVDDVAGVYKQRHLTSFPNEPLPDVYEKAEDVLEIVKTAPGEAYIRARLIFDRGHICAFHGIAKVEGGALVYRKAVQYNVYERDMPSKTVDAQCVLSLTPARGKITFGDQDDICLRALHNCGARGMWRDQQFDLKSRRTIRYMPRLLASQEYREAVQARGK